MLTLVGPILGCGPDSVAMSAAGSSSATTTGDERESDSTTSVELESSGDSGEQGATGESGSQTGTGAETTKSTSEAESSGDSAGPGSSTGESPNEAQWTPWHVGRSPARSTNSMVFFEGRLWATHSGANLVSIPFDPEDPSVVASASWESHDDIWAYHLVVTPHGLVGVAPGRLQIRRSGEMIWSEIIDIGSAVPSFDFYSTVGYDDVQERVVVVNARGGVLTYDPETDQTNVVFEAHPSFEDENFRGISWDPDLDRAVAIENHPPHDGGGNEVRLYELSEGWSEGEPFPFRESNVNRSIARGGRVLASSTQGVFEGDPQTGWTHYDLPAHVAMSSRVVDGEPSFVVASGDYWPEPVVSRQVVELDADMFTHHPNLPESFSAGGLLYHEGLFIFAFATSTVPQPADIWVLRVEE